MGTAINKSIDTSPNYKSISFREHNVRKNKNKSFSTKTWGTALSLETSRGTTH